jgi:hypothetical protein
LRNLRPRRCSSTNSCSWTWPRMSFHNWSCHSHRWYWWLYTRCSSLMRKPLRCSSRENRNQWTIDTAIQILSHINGRDCSEDVMKENSLVSEDWTARYDFENGFCKRWTKS